LGLYGTFGADPIAWLCGPAMLSDFVALPVARPLQKPGVRLAAVGSL